MVSVLNRLAIRQHRSRNKQDPFTQCQHRSRYGASPNLSQLVETHLLYDRHCECNSTGQHVGLDQMLQPLAYLYYCMQYCLKTRVINQVSHDPHEKLSGRAVNSHWLVYGRFAARDLRMAQRFVHNAAKCDDDCTH